MTRPAGRDPGPPRPGIDAGLVERALMAWNKQQILRVGTRHDHMRAALEAVRDDLAAAVADARPAPAAQPAVDALTRREDPMWQAGWIEGISTVWRHARWFEPHEAVPVPGSEIPLVRSTKRPGAKCATCGEALNGWHRASPVLPADTAARDDDGEARDE